MVIKATAQDSPATIRVANNGVFWQVGSSATLGTSTLFAGNILADQSITLNTTAKILCGRALARIGAVTMDTNTISNLCSGTGIGPGTGPVPTDFGSGGFSGGGVTVPEPATLVLLGVGLLGMFIRTVCAPFFSRRRCRATSGTGAAPIRICESG